jgi:hypothetical protein
VLALLGTGFCFCARLFVFDIVKQLIKPLGDWLLLWHIQSTPELERDIVVNRGCSVCNG